jgi:hypothetical protein
MVCNAGYKKELRDRYLEIVFNEGEPGKVLAEEMFQTFESLLIIRFGDIIFQRGELWMVISPKISQELIDEINGRLNIVDLIANSPKVMNFHSIGNGNYAGHTNPNSQSKASLKVNRNTGEWHDKATSIGGMPIHWISYEAGYTVLQGTELLRNS